MTSSTKKFIRIRAKKPVGGYILLTVQQLCLLWWLYRSRAIQLLDLRVWCAAHEMVARRCKIAPDRIPEYTPRELHRLVGGRGGDRLRASLRRLDSLGLLTWSPHALVFARSPDDIRHIENFSGFAQMFDNVPNHSRRVPVPRQALRLIASGVRPAVIATILGTSLRCLYYHPRQTLPVESGGWWKCSWIADVFQINLRNVKAARRHLVALGWLTTFSAPQRIQNRWGMYAQVNLAWERPKHDKTTADAVVDAVLEPIPAPVFSPEMPTPELPPPLILFKPLQERKHQQPTLEPEAPPAPPAPLHHTKPAYGGPKETGVQNETQEKKTTCAPPTLRHIVPEDLRDTERLLALFTQAKDLQLVGTSDSARLAFVAAAEHATIIGTANPCGLFATLVRKQFWHFATESDEDAAHARLKRHFYGTQPAGSTSASGVPLPLATPTSHPSTPPPLSKDAFTVRMLTVDLARAGFHGDVFAVLHREYSEWTHERWDKACAELAAAEQAHRAASALARVGTVTAAVLEDNTR